MTDREFLERVEQELRTVAAQLPHETYSSRGTDGQLAEHHISAAKYCDRCRLDRLADEAADRAVRVAA